MEFIRGQKSKLSDITNNLQLDVSVAIKPGTGQTIDVSCFGLDANGMLSDDRYFIFYNQKSSPCGSITAMGAQGVNLETFRINLGSLPAGIKKLVFTATLDGSGSMSSIGASALRLSSGNSIVATFQFSGSDFAQEKAIIIAELYFKDIWRFAANGQGFNGGLSALLKNFGGEETSAPAPPSRTTAPPPPPKPAAPAPAPPEQSKVNLGKVSLDKRGSSQAVNLKKGGGIQRIHVNLNWNQPQQKKGFLSFFTSDNVDLDLGCMFRLSNGMMGVIQPLGNSFGSKTGEPFIYLDQDDRSGSSLNGENLYILRPDMINLVVVFAMIYEGSSNFSTVNGRLTIKDDAGSEIFIPLDSPDATRNFCAVAKIEKEGGSIRITKEELYFISAKECDEHYGFGFRWVAGQK